MAVDTKDEQVTVYRVSSPAVMDFFADSVEAALEFIRNEVFCEDDPVPVSITPELWKASDFAALPEWSN